MDQRPRSRPRLDSHGEPRHRGPLRRAVRGQVGRARRLLFPPPRAEDPVLSRQLQERGVVPRLRRHRGRPVQHLSRVRPRRLPPRPDRRARRRRRSPRGGRGSLLRSRDLRRTGLPPLGEGRPLRRQEPERPRRVGRAGEDRGPRLRQVLRRGRGGAAAEGDAHVHGAGGRQRGGAGAGGGRVGRRLRGRRDGHGAGPVAGGVGRDGPAASDRVLRGRAGGARADVGGREGLPEQVFEERAGKEMDSRAAAGASVSDELREFGFNGM
ncbi:putative mitogen-activated protein kinase kinase kinase NPK1 [Iris pallida]|uniref:Mitogen-activated protein kinase kinase kinase NPK1 n=1 Tax=Iris pallida TaxID=29817 RepID=A0AAX6DNY9_IRIPA|nr:putative mitogen-activated protein kinase kinase kinase NPK1 [Iris pallida]